MNNQQVPKADSKFQKIVKANHKKWKIRLLSKGGQKADTGGGPYKEKPDYKMGKSAPDMLEEEKLNEIIVKRGDKFCLVSKNKTKDGKRKSLGCYPTREGAKKREKQVQYFKHLKETFIKEELEKILTEEGIWDDIKAKGTEIIKAKGSELYNKFKSLFTSNVKPSANLEELISKYNIDPKADLVLGRRELQAKFGGFEGYIEFLWKMFDENKSSLSGWTRDKSIEIIKKIAPKYNLEPYIAIGVMSGESGLVPTGIYGQTMSRKGSPQEGISANSTAYGMGGVTHSTYDIHKDKIGVPHYMIWIPEYGIEASIATIAGNLKFWKGDLARAMQNYAGSAAGGERKMAAIEKAKEQYGGFLAEEKKKDDRCTRIAKRKYKAWPSAYASGAVVKCRQGKIWKSVKEGVEQDPNDDFVLSKSTDPDEELGDRLRYDVHLGGKNVAYAVVNPESSEGDGPWICGLFVNSENRGKGLARMLLSAIEKDYSGKTLRLRAKPFKDKARSKEKLMKMYSSLGFTPYDDEGRMYKKAESLDEGRKLGKPSSETNLGDWFKRKGAPGKKGGWVDCNTCRDGKCKPCGRQDGEKRSKYPRCRPTASQCKGYKRRHSNLQREEDE